LGGRVDVMVNNAGLMSIAPLNQAKTDEWDRMVESTSSQAF
jgi:hypothetical protein